MKPLIYIFVLLLYIQNAKCQTARFTTFKDSNSLNERILSFELGNYDYRYSQITNYNIFSNYSRNYVIFKERDADTSQWMKIVIMPQISVNVITEYFIPPSVTYRLNLLKPGIINLGNSLYIYEHPLDKIGFVGFILPSLKLFPTNKNSPLLPVGGIEFGFGFCYDDKIQISASINHNLILSRTLNNYINGESIPTYFRNRSVMAKYALGNWGSGKINNNKNYFNLTVEWNEYYLSQDELNYILMGIQCELNL